jgi:group I intron endonuclease
VEQGMFLNPTFSFKRLEKQMIDKKELKKQYKQTLPPMGVYRIENLVNGKILIGSSKNLTGKANSYKFQLKQGSHMNRELQGDYNRFGEENFDFEVVDYLEPNDGPDHDYTDDLAALEEMWLEKLQPYGEKGYNRT